MSRRKLERGEVKRLLLEFNLVGVKDATLESLIDFADYDGDGEINYAGLNICSANGGLDS